MFWAGYAQQTITPSLDRPVYLAGFGQNRLAESVHDDLYVRALALERGETRLVLAALDLIGLGRVHCQEIERQVGAPLVLACTHTHHGPDTIGLWGPDMATSGVDPLYLARLKETAVATCRAALAELRPARLRATAVHVPGVARNARDPQIVDEELTCIQFCRTGDVPLATLLIFPCHPEVLWEHNPHITSDYPAFLRAQVEGETGAPCLFLAGALGGMMTPDVPAHSFVEAAAMGRTLAVAALAALRGAEAVEVEELAHARRVVTVPMTNPLFQMAMQAGLLPNLVNQAGELETEVNLLRVGQVWLVGVPGELLPELGLALKAELGRAGAQVAAVVGLANDELGYILPQEDFIYPENPFDPGAHYEETMSVGNEVGPRLMDAAHELVGVVGQRN